MGPCSAGLALALEIWLRIGRPALQSTCSRRAHALNSTPRVIRSKVSTVDLRRVPARCLIHPIHRSKLHVAACSRADASHDLFQRATSPWDPFKPPENTQRGLRNRRRPVELPYAPVPSCTAQPREHGSKSELHPNSWARVRPVTLGVFDL